MDGFGFQELSEIYRAEMYSNPLSKVRKDLYRAMADLLKELRRECFRLEVSDPESVMLIGARDKRSKAEMMAKQISFLRAKKVFNRSLLAAEGMDVNLDDLTPEEERYYHEVLSSNRRQLSVVYDHMNDEEPLFDDGEEPFETVQEDTMVVRILDDLPEFAGPDRTYTLSKEDVVTLPTEIAEGLIRGEKAAEITVRRNIY